VFTGAHSQLVLMSIEPGDDIGLETHEAVDQILYAVDGEGTAMLNGVEYEFKKGGVICVPAGMEHNFVNDGDEPLRLFTIYSPPQHAAGTIERSKPVESGVLAQT
jgi:mannose-6-phosphate isomerase-like protein (cupin superfamily)